MYFGVVFFLILRHSCVIRRGLSGIGLNQATPARCSRICLFQLDDSKSLHEKWRFHQTTIRKRLFRVLGVNNGILYLPYQLVQDFFHQRYGLDGLFKMMGENIQEKHEETLKPPVKNGSAFISHQMLPRE